MSRQALIFGNGLGMAVYAHYFSLGSGLQSVWHGSEHFTQEHKRLMTSAIAGLSVEEFPESEEQLDQLQVAIVASEFLKGFESEQVKWLSDMSREFPQAFRRFVHEVAMYFHNSGETLPRAFIDPLSEFVKETKSHVGVLNYDNLLYDSFLSTGVLSGYDGTLIDGFHKAGFAKKNLDRRSVDQLGWYLHLHGSPLLYIGNRKLMGFDRAFLVPDETSHIVLTHVEHKPLVIASSPILGEYWFRFSKALKEAEKVVIFGYSGCDTHLNDTIMSNCPEKEFHVIEWSGSGKFTDRLSYWKKIFERCIIKLQHFADPLKFVDWFNI